ncbi:MAG: PEPxxWA-CTERM sorting domain-containing protein [Caulobacteraceae bacterium]|nr:PEPxxWA-CTERM sorting domain-containing protein [Caulobacteraceae bacterium]
MSSKFLFAGAAAALSLAAAHAASAGVVTLNFDALNGGSYEEPLNYYAGGAGSDGTTGGPNYGITFSSNAITGCEQGYACANTNAANAPSAPNILFFLSGAAATMDVTGGFNTGFSFYYSDQVGFTGTINVWSGLDDTGTLLATLSLPSTPNPYTVFVPIGVAFTGTAHSVDFGGSADYIAFDNITLGASSPTVPEPASWALMLVGVGGLGAALRGSRRKAIAAA